MPTRPARPRCDFGHDTEEVRWLTIDPSGTEIKVCADHYTYQALNMQQRGLKPPLWEQLAPDESSSE